MARQPWLPYAAPLILFVLLSSAEASLGPSLYPLAYAAKILIVSIAAFLARHVWADLKPQARDLLPGVLIGIVVCVLWIGLDRWTGYPHLGTRQAYNPFEAISDPAQRALFLAARFYGLVLLVPLIEELFWRDFLLRFLSTREDFRSRLPAQFTLEAAAISGAAFAFSHPEWLAALVTAAAYTALLAWRKSVFACVVAHAVTNLCLGLYVLQTGDWKYW